MSSSTASGANPTPNPDETLISATMADMQREVEAIEAERKQAHLAKTLEDLKKEKAAGFPTLTDRTKPVDPLALERSLRSVDPTTYAGDNQRAFDTFLRDCKRTFLQKPVTYESPSAQVLYAENYLSGAPADDWHREKEATTKAAEGELTWKIFADFLQEKLKPKHLRLMDLGGQLKKLRQFQGQTVSDFVTYLESLEAQLPEPPTEMQKHSNLLHSVHDYLKTAVIRAGSQGTTRAELVEAVRIAERVEPKPDGWKKTFNKSRNQNRNNQSSSTPKPEEDGPADAPQAPVINPNHQSNKRKLDDQEDQQDQEAPPPTRPKGNRSDKDCWNCGKMGHLQFECRSRPSPRGSSRRPGKGRGQ